MISWHSRLHLLGRPREPVNIIDAWMHVVWAYDHQNTSTPKKPVGSIDAWIGEWMHADATGKAGAASLKSRLIALMSGCARFNERSYQPRGE